MTTTAACSGCTGARGTGDMTEIGTEVRPLLADQWALLKSVRLRALADAPDAFSTTLAQAQARTDEDWKAAALRSHGPGQTTQIAFCGDEPCGMMVGIVSAGESAAPPSAELLAAWVVPSQRGTGVAAALVEAVAGWATGQGAAVLRAWVMEDNPHALGFYHKIGFRATGQRQDFGRGRPRMALLMERTLAR